jgi:hypothetical protein
MVKKAESVSEKQNLLPLFTINNCPKQAGNPAKMTKNGIDIKHL